MLVNQPLNIFDLRYLHMKPLLILMSLLLVLLIVGLWVGPGSYPDRWRTTDTTDSLKADNTKKKDEIEKIEAELSDLESGSAAIEERARSELGMTKKGETFYEVILQPKSSSKKPQNTIIKKNQETDSSFNIDKQ